MSFIQFGQKVCDTLLRATLTNNNSILNLRVRACVGPCFYVTKKVFAQTLYTKYHSTFYLLNYTTFMTNRHALLIFILEDTTGRVYGKIGMQIRIFFRDC